jgi:hypothetical protein
MTIPLQHVADGSVADHNFQTLQRLVLDTGGITASVRWGIAGITFSGGTTSATETVPHGLGRAPAVVLTTVFGAPAFDKIMTLNTANYSTTGFDANARINAAHTGVLPFCWLVIG